MIVPDKLTPLTLIEAARALCAAYRSVFSDELSRSALCCLLAQTALETGQWHAIHCYNWGNVKAGGSWLGDVCMFHCGEIIDGNEVFFDPPHPQTHFRAYPSAAAGAEAYVRFLGTASHPPKPNRYQAAWDAAMAGDIESFVDELSTARYFTASVDRYRAEAVTLYQQFQRELPENIEG